MLIPNIVNHHELRVVGLSRSGNHAIIHWLRGQAAGRVCFLNCAEPKTNPYQTSRPLGDGLPFRASYPSFSLEREAAGNFSEKDWLLYSYEDCFLSTVCHADFERQHDAYLGRSGVRTDILILRDPYNLFASRLKSQYGGLTPLTTVRIWKQHARQFLGEKQYVNQSFLPISFNRWVAERDYRQSIADSLGLSFSDAGFEKVPLTGGGSSFDSRRFDGSATSMDLAGRWRHFAHEPTYRAMLDAETLRLADAIFGEVEQSPEFAAFRESLGTRRHVGGEMG